MNVSESFKSVSKSNGTRKPIGSRCTSQSDRLFGADVGIWVRTTGAVLLEAGLDVRRCGDAEKFLCSYVGLES